MEPGRPQRWRQIDQTSATKQKERSEEEKGGEEVERNDISFPAAEEKLADGARDELQAHFTFGRIGFVTV